MTDCGADKAKNTPPHLLVPATSAPDRAQSQAALQRIRARAEPHQPGPFNWPEWKSLRDEGRP